MERMRQADGDIERKHDVRGDINSSDIVSACRIQPSLSSNSVPEAIPDLETRDVSHQPHVFGVPSDIVRLFPELNKGNDDIAVLVGGGLAHHHGTVRPAGVVLVVDSDVHPDPKVGEHESVRVERAALPLPSRARRDVDDLDLSDELVAEFVGGDGNLVDGDELVVDVSDRDDDVGGHDRPLSLFLAATAARLRLEGKLRMISLITRDEVSTAKEV